jgi:hypothetical protein
LSWRVLLYDTIEHWVEERAPSTEQVVGLEHWLLALVDSGPPIDAIAVPFAEDLFAARVDEVDAVITFLVIPYEQLIILKSVE